MTKTSALLQARVLRLPRRLRLSPLLEGRLGKAQDSLHWPLCLSTPTLEPRTLARMQRTARWVPAFPICDRKPARNDRRVERSQNASGVLMAMRASPQSIPHNPHHQTPTPDLTHCGFEHASTQGRVTPASLVRPTTCSLHRHGRQHWRASPRSAARPPRCMSCSPTTA